MTSIFNQVKVILDEMRLVNGIKLVDIIDTTTLNQIVLQIASRLPKSNQTLVTEFNDTFKVEREVSTSVINWKTKELRFQLILEETIELAFALGYTRDSLVNIFRDLGIKVYNKSPYIDNGEKITEVLDALLDLLYVTHGALDTFNLASIAQEGMNEVHKSNISKLCETQEILIDTIKMYNAQDIEIISEQQSDGTYIVKNRKTNKVLKSINYTPVNLKQLLIKNEIL